MIEGYNYIQDLLTCRYFFGQFYWRMLLLAAILLLFFDA